MSRFWKATLVFAVLNLVTLAAFYRQWNRPCSPADRQFFNMGVAAESVPRVDEILASDPGFKDVYAMVYTDLSGSLGLFGYVEKSDDLSRLMRAIANERLSVPVYWGVRVRAEEPKREPG